jgi:hypothetical protein
MLEIMTDFSSEGKKIMTAFPSYLNGDNFAHVHASSDHNLTTTASYPQG